MPDEFEALMLRVNARRVARACQLEGQPIPPGAAFILADDTDEAIKADCEAFSQWAASHGLEVIAYVPDGDGFNLISLEGGPAG